MASPQGAPYGVLYDYQKPLKDLANANIKFVRIQWIDYINTVRFRVVPTRYFLEMHGIRNGAEAVAPANNVRPGIGLTKASLGLVGLNVAPGFGAVGEHLYVPDLSSWRVCTYAPGHASVMGYLQEKTPHPQHGLTVPLCPRTLLKRIVDDAEMAGIRYLVGVESEFILLKQTRPAPVFAAIGDWSCSSKTRTGSAEAAILERIATCLLDAGVELQMYHAEAAPGQFEVVTGPLPPLEAADALVFTRETIYNVAHSHGYKAPSRRASTTIRHLLPRAPRAADAALAPTLTPAERSFLAGVLAHLPAALALTLPTAASYARMRDGVWAGGTYACWGTYNREAPLRACGGAGAHHFEAKCVDGTSAPHLALAALLAAGTRGPVAEMSAEEREAVGLGEGRVKRLPLSIGEAREALRKDAVMREMLGEEFVSAYLGVNELMERWMKGKDEAETTVKLVEYF
ncbi:glutamine synthetase/guanido kinase [Epithele typhae]|uniref:glutamine synthetase/guanido kinase n=1 Tax=Epithele typhae TaxID=378194 RepID=UPI0020081E1E|nr:glutamine synthetase/guanido kinase [Epithele typhae]KAH9918703.1 glutamine synthetase/guanido kinase [Epithele typhae]